MNREERIIHCAQFSHYPILEHQEMFDYDQYRYLMFSLPVIHGAKCIVETGLGDGHSTRIFLEALKQTNGILHTFELSPKQNVADYVSKLATQNKLTWVLWKGNSLDNIKAFTDSIEIDFLYIDSLHTYDHVTAELSAFEPYLSNKCIIMADDTCHGENLEAVPTTLTPDGLSDVYWALEDWRKNRNWKMLNFVYPSGKAVLYK